MRDIWNPWHGCKKKSEGCAHCYMYYLDEKRGQDGSLIFKVKNNFDYPIQRDKYGNFKIKSGEYIRVCMTSDFFLEEADEWRQDAWDIMRIRNDVIFMLITKRPERVRQCLPLDWGSGWENIWFNVTTENQKRADERIPMLLDLPFKHKGILVAPFIEEIHINKYLSTHKIETVSCGGENYDGARPLHYEWVKQLADDCKNNDIGFTFFETGNVYIKNGKRIYSENKFDQMKQAYLENLNYESSKPQFFNIPNYNNALFLEEKIFKPHCKYCSIKKQCSGCGNCGKCNKDSIR